MGVSKVDLKPMILNWIAVHNPRDIKQASIFIMIVYLFAREVSDGISGIVNLHNNALNKVIWSLDCMVINILGILSTRLKFA